MVAGVLTFIRSYVAAGLVLPVRSWHAALIRPEQMTLAVGAATGVASVNRRANRREGHGLCRSAVVLQRPKQGIGVVHIAGAVEVAAAIAAQVVALRGHGAGAVSTGGAIRDNAVLDRQ